MVESLMEDKRVVFPRREQKRFLLEVKEKSGFSWEALSKKAGVSRRTLTDWKLEKYSLPLKALKIFLKLSALDMPKSGEIRKSFWWVHDAAKKAGRLVYQRYGTIGDPVKRKQRWLEWWQTKGRFHSGEYFVSKRIAFPKQSEDLAEFVGIMLGDGGITDRQVAVTVHYKDDRAYSLFIKRLMQQLFDVKPSLTIRVKRSTIICLDNLGLTRYIPI